MHTHEKIFLRKSEKTAFDLQHRKTIAFNMSKYNAAVEKGRQQWVDLEGARQKAASLKREALQNLDEYLLVFEKNFTRNGGKVLWASNAKEAMEQILEILTLRGVKKVVKSKSMTTEEIEFNEALEEAGITSIETDLGEFIVQEAGEKPYHIVTPAMHKSKKDIARLFHEKFNTPPDSSAEDLTLFVREYLRKQFISADAGITGANFLLPGIGGIALTENEGNALMSTAFPKIHIAIAGIEKIIPSVKDLGLFWTLLSSHGTGQKMTCYNSVFTGPKRNGEADGPEEMFVILLDNGRTELLRQPKQNIALTCIRCGACLNACPVYRNIGGYTYESVYSGPIGSVITPFYKGFRDFKHLSFACTICGKCTEVCPVKIDLHKLMLYNRRDTVENKHSSWFWNFSVKAFKNSVIKRKRMDFFSPGMKNLGMKTAGKNLWGKRRNPLKFKKSFQKQYMLRYSKNTK